MYKTFKTVQKYMILFKCSKCLQVILEEKYLKTMSKNKGTLNSLPLVALFTSIFPVPITPP